MYEVPASKASKGQDQFDFKIGTKSFKVKKAKFLAAGTIEDLTSGDLTLMLDAFGKRGTAIGDAVRALEIDQVKSLADAWVADSGMTPGESKAS